MTPCKKILILAAQPKASSPQRLDQEVRDIANGLERAKHRHQFQLEQRWAVTPRDMQRAMLDVEPQIVHFLGGSRDAPGDDRGLVWEDDSGHSQLVSSDALAALFKLFADSLECVMLSDAYSEQQAKAIAQHINFVVGMQRAISHGAEIAFAVGFYDALGAGRSVKFAFELGRAAIRFAQPLEASIPVLHREKLSLPKVEIDAVTEATSLEDHYGELVKAIAKGRFIPFLGSDVNLCDRTLSDQEQVEPWHPECPFPPSGKELARYLADQFPPPPPVALKRIFCPLCQQDTQKVPGAIPEDCPLVTQSNQALHENTIVLCPHGDSQESLTVRGEPLQYLSQYAYLTNPGDFYEHLLHLQLGSQPNQLHRFFAALPGLMRQKGHYPPYPLIVTSNYDRALEQAFEEAEEPFDLVFYSNLRDSEKQDRFIHRTPDGQLHKIERPNQYQELRFEERPVILKLYGSVDQIQEGGSLVITEENYIEYFVSRDLSNLLPVQIRRKINFPIPNMVFLGYTLGDWNQRIILHRIWQNLTSTKPGWWAIQSNPEPFAQRLWKSYNVTLFDVPLQDYITELEQRLRDLPATGEHSHG